MTWTGPIPCHPVEAVGCVYVEVPKAGATSIKWALSPFKGGPPEHEADIHPWFGYTEARDLEQLYEWLGTRWAGFFRFTVVRDPVERFRSFYYGNRPEPGDINHYVLTAFEHDGRWRTDVHVVPQTELIGTELDRFDFIGRIEDMAEVQRKLRANVATEIRVPHLNRSNGDHEPLRPKAEDRLRKFYREDYRVLYA